MKVYVAGPLEDVVGVQAVQSAVIRAGHELTLDWSRESDVDFTEGYAARPDLSARVAGDDLDAVLDADAVLVVTSQHDGRGMFVELGAALARARDGDLAHVVVLGPRQHESVFFHHPLVQRFPTVEDWLATLG